MNTTILNRAKKIKEVQEDFGFCEKTINFYQCVYKRYFEYVNDTNALYEKDTYVKFLYDEYGIDIKDKSLNRSNTRIDNLCRSMELLEDLDSYIAKNKRIVLPKNRKDTLTDDYVKLVDRYKWYCEKVRNNVESTVKVKGDYVSNLLAYFISININDVKQIDDKVINNFINSTVSKGERSKSRYFFVLRDFLIFLYSEDILLCNYSYLVPSMRKKGNKRIPTYIKEENIKDVLDKFPRERKIDKRDYAIILMAVELGMRISDILNLKFENIDWEEKKISFYQVKTGVLNTLPLSKELGWAIIDYLKNGRPVTNSHYIFVTHNPPFDKMNRFNQFNKYFNTEIIEYNDSYMNGIHTLRRSIATRMNNSEIPIDIISSTLGHVNSESEKSYIKVDKNRLKDCGMDVK